MQDKMWLVSYSKSDKLIPSCGYFETYDAALEFFKFCELNSCHAVLSEVHVLKVYGGK